MLTTCLAVAQQKKVMVMDIKSGIDVRTNHYVELALKHAEETKADIVLIDMSTYGGLVQDAQEISDRIIAFKKPVWVFIHPNAFSAGALISISCDSIYMSGGAKIGAATVVDGEGNKTIEKYQSAMRTTMRSAAEHSHRDPKIAEGMVDERTQVEGLPTGRIITFTTSEALKFGYCEAQAETIDEILKRYKLENATIDHFELSNVDSIIDFFMNPLISGLLILIILGGIYFELQAPGLGFPGAAAVTALILYLVPYYIHGIAENWEIIAFVFGIILIGLEVFVIPGFGIAGIAGIAITFGSLVLMMLNNNLFDFEFVETEDIIVATSVALGGLLGGVIVFIFGSSKLTNTKAFQRMALTETQQSAEGYSVNVNKERMKGKTGVAFTVLRPSGKVMIDNQLYDAFSQAGYIEKGSSILVMEEEGSTLRVKAAN